MRSHLSWENQRAFIASPLCGKKREEKDEEVGKEEGGRRKRKKNKERSTRHFQRKQRQVPWHLVVRAMEGPRSKVRQGGAA